MVAVIPARRPRALPAPHARTSVLEAVVGEDRIAVVSACEQMQRSGIDRWVIAQAAGLACEQPGRCHAVNLAAKTIAEPGLVGYIAHSFVRELASNRVDRLVVQAILHIASGMGLPTVAEYVVAETVDQTLRKLGVDYGQGFHFGKPAPLPVLL